MPFYSHVPFVVFESAPRNPLLHSKPTLGGGQGAWWASLTRPASHSSSILGAFVLYVPCVSLCLSGNEGYETVLPQIPALATQPVPTGSSSPTNMLPNHLLVDGPIFLPCPRKQKPGMVQRSLYQTTWKGVTGTLMGKLMSMTRGPKRKTAGASKLVTRNAGER